MMETIPTAQHPRGPFTDAETPDTAPNRIRLNHPKNYLAVPLAAAADGETRALIREYAVNAVRDAERGAEELGLITSDGNRTALGDAIVVTGTREHGSPTAALAAFETLHRSQTRFIDAFPEWRAVAERVAFQYAPTTHLVEFLREQGDLQLAELTWHLWKRDPALAETVFLNPSVTASTQISPASRPASRVLADAAVYRAESAFQYKAFLYHCGIVTERGRDTARLDPTTDTWALTPELTND